MKILNKLLFKCDDCGETKLKKGFKLYLSPKPTTNVIYVCKKCFNSGKYYKIK